MSGTYEVHTGLYSKLAYDFIRAFAIQARYDSANSVLRLPYPMQVGVTSDNEVVFVVRNEVTCDDFKKHFRHFSSAVLNYVDDCFHSLSLARHEDLSRAMNGQDRAYNFNFAAKAGDYEKVRVWLRVLIGTTKSFSKEQRAIADEFIGLDKKADPISTELEHAWRSELIGKFAKYVQDQKRITEERDEKIKALKKQLDALDGDWATKNCELLREFGEDLDRFISARPESVKKLSLNAPDDFRMQIRSWPEYYSRTFSGYDYTADNMERIVRLIDTSQFQRPNQISESVGH